MADPRTVLDPAVTAVLAELEVQRKKIVNAKWQGSIAFVAGILLFFLHWSLGLIGIVLAVVFYKRAPSTEAYRYRFKKEIIGAALKSVDPSLSIDPEKGISERAFDASRLFSMSPDRYGSQDMISGNAGKTAFCFAEVDAQYKTESTNSKGETVTYWHKIFKGIIFIADFNKNFNGHTIVRPKGFGDSWFNSSKVKLEDKVFGETFSTFSTDQVEARYLLTPAMMERITALNARSASTISVSFIDSCLYIAFPTREDFFEAPVYYTLLAPGLLDRDMSVLHFMYGIVTDLDLNTRIWTKR